MAALPIQCMIGQAYEKLGDKGKAIEYYRKVLQPLSTVLPLRMRFPLRGRSFRNRPFGTMSTSCEPVIRLAIPDDAESIARLSEQLRYPSTGEETAQRLIQVIRQTTHAVYFAEADGG